MRSASSLRRRSVEDTWEIASRLAPTLGITRVTDITPLDQFGVPVYTAVRPDAVAGSLCVSAGKGATALEAKVGAVMEAIELAIAEPRRQALRIVQLPARLVGGGRFTADDLAPLHGRRVPGDALIPCVAARDLATGDEVLIPVELVLFPVDRSVPGAGIYGSGGNGLASGNDLEEATVHALAECIERDIMAFQLARDDSTWVAPEFLPEVERRLCGEADALGFDLVFRSCPSEFGIAQYHVLLSDRGDRRATHFGSGCHPRRDIALRRAVTEAYQSRLTSIHGARDDLPDFGRRYAHLPSAELAARMAATVDAFCARTGAIAHGDVPDHPACGDLATAHAFLVELIARVTGVAPLAVVLTPPDAPLAVVRVVAPRLELSIAALPRMGPRLRERLSAR